MKGKLLVVSVFALVFIVGCVGGGGNTNSVSGNVNATEFVPNENVDGVFHVDMAILEDQTTKDLTNALIEVGMEQNPNYDGPTSYEDIWKQFNQSSNAEFNPRDLNEVVIFTEVPEDTTIAQNESLGAAVLSTDLTEEEMVSLIEQNATVEEGEYNGVPFYTVKPKGDMGTTQTSYMAVLQEGVYSFGQEGPVRSTVDVAQGDADALSGKLREELDRVRDGYINFAVKIPEDALNGTGTGAGQRRFGAFRKVSVVSGSYYTEGETMGLSVNMRAGNAEDAQGISDAIGGLTFVAQQKLGENASAVLDPLETNTDGSTVLVTYETTVDEFVGNLEKFQSAAMTGPGSGPGPGPGPGAPSGGQPESGFSGGPDGGNSTGPGSGFGG